MLYLIEKINEFLSPLYNYLLTGLGLSSSENIFDGELIRINLTWGELPTICTTFLVVLLIVLFIKLISKILGVFIWR